MAPPTRLERQSLHPTQPPTSRRRQRRSSRGGTAQRAQWQSHNQQQPDDSSSQAAAAAAEQQQALQGTAGARIGPEPAAGGRQARFARGGVRIRLAGGPTLREGAAAAGERASSARPSAGSRRGEYLIPNLLPDLAIQIAEAAGGREPSERAAPPRRPPSD